MTERVLSVERLGVWFDTPWGQVEAVEDVSFELRQGEALGIVGESGSGKTVTCRSILGLLPSNANMTGRVTVEDADVARLSPRELARFRGRRIGMIFQNPSSYLDPVMRVGDQIAEGLRHHFDVPRRDGRASSIELLRHVRIADPERRVDDYPHQLSGGMKQRVMIAGALACRPRILIADEPTTALDVTVQARILDLLRALRQEERLSMILVSHDLGVIASVCDRVVVMKDGGVVEQGGTQEVLRRPTHRYTRELIGANPSLASSTEGSRPTAASAPVISVEGLSVTFGRRRGRLARALLGEGPPPVEAVVDVNLSVAEGEALGIVGESGSGKTTLGRAIAGLAVPSGGRVVMREDLRAARRPAIQMVFQDPFASLDPRYTVERALAEPLRWHRVCPPDEVGARILELMAAVELSPTLRGRRPHELSGGQCQRVAIARALATEPRALVADEITSSLDVTIQKQILNLLRSLRERLDLTIVLISHDLGVVRSLCDRVAVMHEGRLVEEGPTTNIMRSPTETYTRELIAAIPSIPQPEP
ncbi:MAG TPA: ABC transporter ATP-binding protein [Actinomycetota bacterium]|nr:ABC transporter ATP-binding protein [Actinomycetota bacterium]